MINKKFNLYFFSSSFVSFLLFLPFFLGSNIGSDWDSYALIGTYENYLKYQIYIPSRPPGFPLYELIVGILIGLSKSLLISSEQLLLSFQFLLLLSLNYLILKFFQKNNNSNFFIYLIIIFSPIYLISGLSLIDYFLGSLFGFLSIYIIMYSKKNKFINIIVPLFLSISITARLSNLIFLLVVFMYLVFYNKNLSSGLTIISLTLLISSLFYLIFYQNLFSFYKISGIYNNWSDMLCLFNLTNTDHSFFDRVGRFVLKQIAFLGTLGFVLLFLSIFQLKFDIRNKYLYIFILFVLFELSFLRLPTEEGHLLPAFIAFMLLLRENNNKIFLYIFLFVFLSNFVDLKFYEVDLEDSASDITFGLEITNGFLIDDYNLRSSIANEKLYHYKNSQLSLYNAWSNGCPNK